MSIQQARPMDTLQNIITSFKKFEKKLDKLQDDVKYHGHTLSELRVMVANLSNGTKLNPDGQHEEPKLLNKTTTMQLHDRQRFEVPLKKKRKNVLSTLSSEATSKSLDNTKNRLLKIPGSTKSGLDYKVSLRKKSELPRNPAMKDKSKKRIKNTTIVKKSSR